MDRSRQPVQLLRLPPLLCRDSQQQIQGDLYLVPDPGHHQPPQRRELECTNSPIKASYYFDFLTNDDDVKEKYLGGMNNYNFRQYSYGDESFADFLQKNKASLGVPSNIDYHSGSDEVYNSFKKDVGKSYASDIVILLRHIRVLLYNGQDDYVVNTAGVLQYLNSLGWENIASWKRAKKERWTIGGETRGWAKTSGNLWFVLVNGAGHLVPADQP